MLEVLALVATASAPAIAPDPVTLATLRAFDAASAAELVEATLSGEDVRSAASPSYSTDQNGASWSCAACARAGANGGALESASGTLTERASAEAISFDAVGNLPPGSFETTRCSPHRARVAAT